MASLIRTLSLGLVVIAVTLHTATANTAKYPLTQQAGGKESTLSDDEITLVQPVWDSGPGCTTGALRFSMDMFEHTQPNLDNTDGTLTFTDTMSFFIYIYFDTPQDLVGTIISYTGGTLMVFTITGGFVVYTPSGDVSTGNIGLAVATWHHIGFTFANQEIRLYVNGNRITQKSPVTIDTTGNQIQFGGEYVGKMACAYFSSDALNEGSVLDDGSVLELYDQGCPCGNICEDCYCYVDNCYDVGYEYCNNDRCSNCDRDHCCCCEKDMEKCIDKPCTCINPDNTCSDLDMEYCEQSECQGHCHGAQCCCTKEVQCPVWSECHCMVQKCSEVANMHDCDRCCNDCQFGYCCCCDKDWPVCPKDRECHCTDRSCDEIAGYGYCDPSKCTMAFDSSPNSLVNRYWANYVCPSDQCCCKMVLP